MASFGPKCHRIYIFDRMHRLLQTAPYLGRSHSRSWRYIPSGVRASRRHTNSQHHSLCITRDLLALYPDSYRLSFDLPHASFAIVQGIVVGHWQDVSTSGCGLSGRSCITISHGWSLSILGLMRLGHERRHVHMYTVKIRINDEIISITITIPCHFQISSVTLRNAQTP